MAEWIKKEDLTICCLQETQSILKDTQRLRMKGWEKYFKQMITKKNKNKKKQEQLFQTKQTLKMVKTYKGDHYIMIKGTIDQEYVTILNVYIPNIKASKHIKQKLTKLKEKKQ